MAEPTEIWGSIEDMTEFTLTGDHLKLLQHAHVSWLDAEYGSPMIASIDPKRPYGLSDVVRSMAEVLGWPDIDWQDEHGYPRPGIEDRCARLHAETGVALQIVLATGEFRPGRYTRSQLWTIDWTRQDS